MPWFDPHSPRKSLLAKSTPPKGTVPPKPPARPCQTPAQGKTMPQQASQPPARPTQAPTAKSNPQQVSRAPARPAGPPQKVMPARPHPSVQPAPAGPARPATQSTPPVGTVRLPAQPADRPQPAVPPHPEQRQPLPRAGAASPGAPQHPLKGFEKKPAFRAVGAAVSSFGAINTARAHQDVAAEVSSLESALDSLRQRSAFGDIQNEIVSLDSSLNSLIQLLEKVRKNGYVFQGDLDEETYQSVGKWESIRERVISTADQQAASFQARLPTLNPQIDRLNAALHSPTAAAPLLRSTRTQLDGMVSEVDRINRSLQEQYSPIQTKARELIRRLTEIQWALDQLPEARFRLEKGEDLVSAVSSRWDKDGKDDPEGILFLTSRRLIFERKQKVATKKVLFITTASELVHEVMVEQPLSNVQGVKSEGKGLFGHQDYIFVQFADSKLGAAAFHLRGQSNKMWLDLIDRARTGRLPRVTGAGISASDINRTLSSADLLALQAEVNQLQDEMMLQQAQQDLAEVENEVMTLSRRLSGLRSRGYAIEKDLEANVAILTAQWDRIKTAAEKSIDQQTRLLGEQMRSIQQLTAHVLGSSASAGDQRSAYVQVKSALAAASSQAEAAQGTVALLYDRYRIEVETTGAHLDWIGWMLDALDTASFQLTAAEYGIAAVEAVWEKPGLEAENGILYLTGQRLIWEDRVGTYELKVNVPLQSVLDLCKEVRLTPESGEEQEVLLFNFGAGTPMPNARFLLAQPVAEDWVKMVGRARAAGYENDLAIKLDPGELERIKNAPSLCPSCNAAYTSPIMRGQIEIVCDYCGVRTRF